jgi:hypothetical protein
MPAEKAICDVMCCIAILFAMLQVGLRMVCGIVLMYLYKIKLQGRKVSLFVCCTIYKNNRVGKKFDHAVRVIIMMFNSAKHE